MKLHDTLSAQARALTTVPAGPAVDAIVEDFHRCLQSAPDAELLLFQVLSHEVYRALRGDAAALALQKKGGPALAASLHMSKVLEGLHRAHPEGLVAVRPAPGGTGAVVAGLPV